MVSASRFHLESAIRTGASLIERTQQYIDSALGPTTEALFEPFKFPADTPCRAIELGGGIYAHEEGEQVLMLAVQKAFFRVHGRDDFTAGDNLPARYSTICHVFKTSYIRSILASSTAVITISRSKAFTAHLSTLDAKSQYETTQDACADAFLAFLGFNHHRSSSIVLHDWLLRIICPMVVLIYKDKLEVLRPVQDQPFDFHRSHKSPVAPQSASLVKEGPPSPFVTPESPQASCAAVPSPASGLSNPYTEARRDFHARQSWRCPVPPHPLRKDTHRPKRPLGASPESLHLPREPRKKPRLNERSSTTYFSEDAHSIPGHSRDARALPTENKWRKLPLTLAQRITSPLRPSPTLVSIPEDPNLNTQSDPLAHETVETVSPKTNTWNGFRRTLAQRLTSPFRGSLSPSPNMAPSGVFSPGKQRPPTNPEDKGSTLPESTPRFSMPGLLGKGKAKLSSSNNSKCIQGLGLVIPSDPSAIHDAHSGRSVTQASPIIAGPSSIPRLDSPSVYQWFQVSPLPLLPLQPPSVSTTESNASRGSAAGVRQTSTHARDPKPMLKKHKPSTEDLS